MTEPLDRRFLTWVCAVALAFRVLVSALTPVPSEDGVNYLWMAERFAAGDAAAALSEVFPPLWPLCVAPLVAAGIDPFRGAQLVAALLGVAAVVLGARAAAAAVPGAGRAAALFLLLVPLPTRFAAECYSAALFLPLTAAALWAAFAARWQSFGALAALAFWTRPEGALLPVALLLCAPRRTWRMWPPFAVLVAGLAAWRWSTGNGFVLEAKGALHAARLWQDGWSFGAWLAHFGGNLLRIPWLWVEAFAAFGLLALWAIVRERRPGLRPLVVLLGLAVLVVCDFLARRRFLAAWTMAVVPLAAAAWVRLPAPGRWPVLFVVMMSNLLLGLRVQDDDRYGERVVGEYLRMRRTAAERVTGDMTRVVYFAGCRPLAPRRYDADDLVGMAREPGVRFVVLGSRRPTAGPVREALAEFAPSPLPASVARWAEERGITVLERR